MKKRLPFLKYFLLLFVSVQIISCHEDFTPIQNDVIGDPNFNFSLYDLSTVKAYSRKTSPVQTNGLPVYQLGVYNDPVYGVTQASILSQVTLNTLSPDFGGNPEIESVILEIPYFSTPTNTEEETTYKLDSIFGNNAAFKISIHESTYYLRDIDPNSGFEDAQRYYSDQGPLFKNYLGSLLYKNDKFTFSNKPVIVPSDEEDGDDTELTPRLWVELDTAFFTSKIFDFENTSELANNNNFKNHFRGINIIAEKITNDGSLVLLNLDNASIKINYTKDSDKEDEDREKAEFTMSLKGISVNTLEHEFPSQIENIISNPNINQGEHNLYLKGGAGTMTLIDLFGTDVDGNGIPDELEVLREKKWLINEASIEISVNQTMLPGGKHEPDRLFLYDIKNNQVLLDYSMDAYYSEADVLNYKSHHLGRLQKDSDGKGLKYKFRITNYISNLINKDSLNVNLGLLVSQNVGITTLKYLQNETPPGFEEVLTGSVICPEGTILYGNTSNPDTSIKLNIFYTEIIE